MPRNPQRGEPRQAAEIRSALVLPSSEGSEGTYVIQFLGTEGVAEGVGQYLPYRSGTGPGRSGGVPKPGDVVLAIRETNSSTWDILAFKSLPRVEAPEDIESAPRYNQDTPRDDYFGGERRAEGGAFEMVSDAGGGLVLHPDGLVELFADELCATRWFPDEQTIRSFYATLEEMGYWGSRRTYTRRDASAEAIGQTQVGVSEWVRSTAETAPTFNIEKGAIPGEEDVRLPGPQEADETYRGSVCLRILIFDSQTAMEAQARGDLPDPAVAKLALRADRNGNVSFQHLGQRTEHSVGYVRHNAGRENVFVEGDSRREVLGSETDVVRGRASKAVAADYTVEVGGDFILRCGRFVMEERNGGGAGEPAHRYEGNYGLEAGGVLSLSGVGGLNLSTGGDSSWSTGRDTSMSSGGSFSHTVLGRSSVMNRGRDVASWFTRVVNGKARTEVADGSWEVVVGPSRSPLAEIKIHGDKRLRSQYGRIEIGFPRQGYGLTISPDGSAQMVGAMGGWAIDRGGRVQLGNLSAPRVGNVVTTETHPTCFVTGAPIRGVNNVVVGARGPARPYVGTPSAGVVPSTLRPPEEPIG